jgi:cation-transporting ATPase I
LITSVASAAILAGIIQTPGVSHFFGCRPLGPIGWATAVGASAGATALAPWISAWLDQRPSWDFMEIPEMLRLAAAESLPPPSLVPGDDSPSEV